MQEQQGNLMPQLSGLPGPRPFRRGKTKMEDNKTTSSNPMHDDGKPDMGKPVTASVDEIVAKTAEAIGAGKAFGGWTDKVEEGATISKLTIPVKLGKGQPAYKEKVSRDDAKAAADMFDSLRSKSKKKPVKENNISKQMARVKALAMKQAKKAADAPLVKIGPDSTRKNPEYTKTIRPSDIKKKVNEETKQLDEIAPFLPFLAMGAKAMAGGLARKAAMGVGRNMIGGAIRKVFKKSKAPGEEPVAS